MCRIHVHIVSADWTLVDLVSDGFVLKYEITDHTFGGLSRDVNKHVPLCTRKNAWRLFYWNLIYKGCLLIVVFDWYWTKKNYE